MDGAVPGFGHTHTLPFSGYQEDQIPKKGEGAFLWTLDEGSSLCLIWGSVSVRDCEVNKVVNIWITGTKVPN